MHSDELKISENVAILKYRDVEKTSSLVGTIKDSGKIP